MKSISYCYKYVLFLVLAFLFNCNAKNKNIREMKEMEAILITAKYCYNDYPPSYYFEGSDSIGVNIYFAGRIFNNTTDTFYIPNRELKFRDKYDFPLEETLYYTLINGDSLFFWSWAPAKEISPNCSIKLKLQYYITPEKP